MKTPEPTPAEQATSSMRKNDRPLSLPTRLKFITQNVTLTPLWRAACILLGLLGAVFFLYLLFAMLGVSTGSTDPTSARPAGLIVDPHPAPPLKISGTPNLAAQVSTADRHNALIAGLIILGVVDVALTLVISALALLESAYNSIRYGHLDWWPYGLVATRLCCLRGCLKPFS